MQKQEIALEERNYVEQQHQLDEEADSTVLVHLRFTTMTHRHEEIHEAHKNTCSWLYRDPEPVMLSGDAENTRPWANFAHWLQHGEEIYWINGKAGSGKSTLMRYIRDNPTTLEHLRSWPGTRVGPSKQSQKMAAMHKPIVINPNKRVRSGIKA